MFGIRLVRRVIVALGFDDAANVSQTISDYRAVGTMVQHRKMALRAEGTAAGGIWGRRHGHGGVDHIPVKYAVADYWNLKCALCVSAACCCGTTNSPKMAKINWDTIELSLKITLMHGRCPSPRSASCNGSSFYVPAHLARFGSPSRHSSLFTFPHAPLPLNSNKRHPRIPVTIGHAPHQGHHKTGTPAYLPQWSPVY